VVPLPQGAANQVAQSLDLLADSLAVNVFQILYQPVDWIFQFESLNIKYGILNQF